MEPETLPELVLHFMTATVSQFLRVALAITVLCIGILSDIFINRPEATIFAALAIIGWSLYFSQEYAVDNIRPTAHDETADEDEDGDGLRQMLFDMIEVFGAALYYSSVISVASAIGLSTATTGYAFAAIALPLVYPVWEMETAQRGIPLSIGGTAAFVYLLSQYIFKTARGTSWSELGFGRFPVIFWSRGDDVRPQ